MKPDLKLFPVPKTVEITEFCGGTDRMIEEIVHRSLPAEGYRLIIGSEGVRLAGGSETGLFYGCGTLDKLRRLYPEGLPCLEIEDTPDFPVRGFLLAGGGNPETMKKLILQLARAGINELQLKIRDNFLLSGHEEICRKTGVVWTPQILRELDSLCRENHIRLVPFINSCGHFEVFLEEEKYRKLALYPHGGFAFPWGDVPDSGTMLAMNDESFDFLTGIYEQILPCFSADTVNIGCDETWELGDRFAEYCRFINRIAEWLRRRGKKCQIWGDILLQCPEAVRLLDPEISILVWGYNDGYPFERNLRVFTEQGRTALACPGTSSYLSVCGRSGTARRNIESAAEAARAVSAPGILNTDWQFLVRPWCLMYGPLAHGAGAGWNLDAAVQADSMAAEANLLFYDGNEPELCRWVERFGHLSDILGTEIVVEDRSTLYCLFEHRFNPETIRAYGITEEKLRMFDRELGELRNALEKLRTATPEGADAVTELRHALDLADMGGRMAWRLLGFAKNGTAELKAKILSDEAALWNRYHPAAGLENALKSLNRMMEC